MKKYSVEIENTVDSVAYCFNKLKKNTDMWDWKVTVNAGGINYGMYFNFDFDNKELEICNEPCTDNQSYLDDIIDMINDDEEE